MSHHPALLGALHHCTALQEPIIIMMPWRSASLHRHRGNPPPLVVLGGLLQCSRLGSSAPFGERFTILLLGSHSWVCFFRECYNMQRFGNASPQGALHPAAPKACIAFGVLWEFCIVWVFYFFESCTTFIFWELC